MADGTKVFVGSLIGSIIIPEYNLHLKLATGSICSRWVGVKGRRTITGGTATRSHKSISAMVEIGDAVR